MKWHSPKFGYAIKVGKVMAAAAAKKRMFDRVHFRILGRRQIEVLMSFRGAERRREAVSSSEIF
jgi:hypothetical protein